MVLDKKNISVGSLEWFIREATPDNPRDKLPVLLLHGFPSQSHSWTVIMPELANVGYHAIAPDWIGFGFSSRPEKNDFAYTPEAFIKALSDLIEELKLDKFHLVVQGFLGSVGIQYALQNPDKIERLIIINAPISTQARLPWKIQQLGLPLVGEMLTQDPLMIDRTLEAGCRYPISDADLDIYRRPLLQTSSAGRAILATLRNFQLSDAIAQIESGLKGWQKPTLIIWGLKDPWLDINPVEKIAVSLVNGELVKLAEAAHYPQEHWSENVSYALISFLRRSPINAN
jgi:pimeloyl-ACP methyl ester carboxylesterase